MVAVSPILDINGHADPNAILPWGFTEWKESGVEDYDLENGLKEYVRIFDGPWINRLKFITDLTSQLTEVEGNQVITTGEKSIAFYPDDQTARAYKVNVQPKLATDKDSKNFIRHAMARVTVNYKPYTYSFPNDRNPLQANLIEESVESSVEILPLKTTTQVYTGDTRLGTPLTYGDPIIGYTQYTDPKVPVYPQYDDSNGETYKDFLKLKEITRTKRVTILHYKLKIPLVLRPRWTHINNSLSCVNKYIAITPSGLVAPIGTLRYDGFSSITKRETVTGGFGWEMEHVFSYYKPGWNTYPDIQVLSSDLLGNSNSIVTDKPMVPILYDYYDLVKIFRDTGGS